ncbi:Nascent polypeptide-associated complex subunit alpha [Tritrichomonas foetus]|uniref:Nascent polypeptide-associated complex subunit alpha n=1 Tax=Tritrichomonas foetus TaxID=1144522 RepID=A0A1J4JUI7_9EUKA|nr:Nascent polypeptide-associated complex subunit alpha [Tritrichomonas foetus]|eukprot:OHT01182.1 Nascent polypeptide-associated complex subunit alpha [Tritrichomonas foetus]
MSETDAAAAPATTEETTPETTEEKPAEETPKPAARKNSRAEKKMKEALLKHNLKQLENVSTVMLRKGQQLMWTFSQPEVYYIENVYVIFGEPTMDDPGARAIDAIKNNATPTETAEPKVSVSEDVDDVEDAEGLKEEDITTIMQQSNVSRNRAIKALREANGDLVTAVMNLAL